MEVAKNRAVQNMLSGFRQGKHLNARDEYSPYFYVASKLCYRGEKLYVTKDKRSKNSYWKQLLCGFTILGVVIAMIIIVLAASKIFCHSFICINFVFLKI